MGKEMGDVWVTIVGVALHDKNLERVYSVVVLLPFCRFDLALNERETLAHLPILP